MRTCFLAIVLVLASSLAARAQSADLVLCDRVAADPSDPDKPADVSGVAEIAASDLATAIRFCRQAAASSRRAMFALGRAYAANHPGALERMGAFAEGGRGGTKDKDAAKAYYERAAALGDADAKAALERLRCPYAIKDKQGKLVITLCF